MTILGKHTVAEVQALGKDLDYQFKQVNEAFKSISPIWIQDNQDRYKRLTSDWNVARQRWAKDSLDVKSTLSLKMGAAGILVSPTIVPAEDEWNRLLRNTAQGDSNGIGQNGDDSLYGVNQAVQTIRSEKTDFSKRPSQIDSAGEDWDFLAYKKVDTAIKTGEAAAKDAAKSNTALMIAGGAALVVTGVVLGKVYLR